MISAKYSIVKNDAELILMALYTHFLSQKQYSRVFLAFHALVYRWGCKFLSLFLQDNEHTELSVLFFFQNPYAIFEHILQRYHDFQSNVAIFLNVVQVYTQPYSFGGKIKLIICQIKHELSWWRFTQTFCHSSNILRHTHCFWLFTLRFIDEDVNFFHFFHKIMIIRSWRCFSSSKIRTQFSHTFCNITMIFKVMSQYFPAYTYSFGGRIKLIICQIRHEASVTIHEISRSWEKNVRWRTQYMCTPKTGFLATNENRILTFQIKNKIQFKL